MQCQIIRQLRYWLDSDNSSGTSFNGMRVIRNKNFSNYSNTTINANKVKMQNVNVNQNSTLTIQVTDFFQVSGNFNVDLGSSLSIHN